MRLTIERLGERYKVSLDGQPDQWIDRGNIEVLQQWLEGWYIKEIQRIEDQLSELEFWDNAPSHTVCLNLRDTDQEELSILLQEQSGEMVDR